MNIPSAIITAVIVLAIVYGLDALTARHNAPESIAIIALYAALRGEKLGRGW